jgi:curved DNA-binding protein CbpA
MASLYEILGLSKNATPEQIEQGYVLQSNKVSTDFLDPEMARLRLVAIKEAFATLSSPTRRQAYDAKFSRPQQIAYEVVEERSYPWVPAVLIVLALAAGVIFYQNGRAEKARAEQMAKEAELARVEAEKVKMLAIAQAEEARLASEKFAQDQRDARNRQMELESLRRDSERTRYEVQQQMERDARAAREKDNAADRVKMQQEREEQMARMRNEQREQALKRALALRVRVPD